MVITNISISQLWRRWLFGFVITDIACNVCVLFLTFLLIFAFNSRGSLIYTVGKFHVFCG